MKKEFYYLSLPDYFNKFLLSNFNEKLSNKDIVFLQFKLNTSYHLGSALKAIYLLEILFPRKPKIFKVLIKKKKKIYFGQKISNSSFFKFNIAMSSFEFIDFYRFFSKHPFYRNKITDFIVINKKLKQFEFEKPLFFFDEKIRSSFFFFNFYHLN